MRKKEKIKWVELKEDDPIFKGVFIISNPKMDIEAPDKKKIKKIPPDKGVSFVPKIF